MTPLIHLNYPIDKAQLLLEAEQVRPKAVAYTDSRYPDLLMDDWLVGHHTSDYVKKIMDDFQVIGKPRFYWLYPHAVIPEHVDNGTLCGLNFILTDHASPITYSGVDYYYEQIALDTTLMHSVTNNEHLRIMFKISIFNESYASLIARIPEHYKKATT